MRNARVLLALAAAASGLATAGPLLAVQFPTQDPNYTQQIYAGPLIFHQEAGMAWTTSGALLTRAGTQIVLHSLTANTIHNATSVHGTTVFNVPNLDPTGTGMTNGLDGYVYTLTSSGMQRFDPANLAAPAQTLAGTIGGSGWGITTLPDGRIAYSDGAAGHVYTYVPNANPNLGANQLIFTAPYLIDGIVAGPTGLIALTNQTGAQIQIITNTGSSVNIFNTPHFPDGLAFASTLTTDTLYSNNNDGTITKYLLGPGFSGTPTTTDIFSGSQSYGDLASVGPDCAFYVTQYENGGQHGSTAGVGTHWDDGSTDADASIVRIAGIGVQADGSVSEVCTFYSPFEPFLDVPEPASLTLLLSGTVLILAPRRRPVLR
jgi:hypothetical protein